MQIIRAGGRSLTILPSSYSMRSSDREVLAGACERALDIIIALSVDLGSPIPMEDRHCAGVVGRLDHDITDLENAIKSLDAIVRARLSTAGNS